MTKTRGILFRTALAVLMVTNMRFTGTRYTKSAYSSCSLVTYDVVLHMHLTNAVVLEVRHYVAQDIISERMFSHTTSVLMGIFLSGKWRSMDYIVPLLYIRKGHTHENRLYIYISREVYVFSDVKLDIGFMLG